MPEDNITHNADLIEQTIFDKISYKCFSLQLFLNLMSFVLFAIRHFKKEVIFFSNGHQQSVESPYPMSL